MQKGIFIRSGKTYHPIGRGDCEKFWIAGESSGYLLRSTPTSSDDDVVLDVDDYELEESIMVGMSSVGVSGVCCIQGYPRHFV